MDIDSIDTPINFSSAIYMIDTVHCYMINVVNKNDISSTIFAIDEH